MSAKIQHEWGPTRAAHGWCEAGVGGAHLSETCRVCGIVKVICPQRCDTSGLPRDPDTLRAALAAHREADELRREFEER